MHTDVQLAVLFADVVGSTRLYEHLGDGPARTLIASALDVLREATESHRGSVVKTMGDEIMATFAAPSDAIAAAARMQRVVGTLPQPADGLSRIAIRIGCHFGPVVLEAADVFGSTVHTANRVTSLAKAGQIMITESVVGRLGTDWQFAVRHVEVATLRGFTEETALFEVLWRVEDATGVMPVSTIGSGGRVRPARLRVRVDRKELTISDPPRTLNLGRAEENDLLVPGSLVSRLHARIEAGRGSFQFVDQSTNGSFVQMEGGEIQFVRRDTVSLQGSGRIGLGREPSADDPGTIYYVCEN
jgi:class 3 adenylate cyclase